MRTWLFFVAFVIAIWLGERLKLDPLVEADRLAR